MITYQEESFKLFFKEAEWLFDLHYQEIARNKDFIKLNPDYEKYFRLEEAGALSLVTARDEGKPLGYVITFLMPHMHYKDHLFGLNDILFIHPNYRGKMAGARMIQFAEEVLARLNVKVLHIGMKLEHDFSPLMKRLGYKPIEMTFEKVLRKE